METKCPIQRKMNYAANSEGEEKDEGGNQRLEKNKKSKKTKKRILVYSFEEMQRLKYCFTLVQ